MFQVATGVTLDANWRWIHGKDGYENCYTGNTWDQGYCPDAATCTENCLLGRTTLDSTELVFLCHSIFV